MFGNLNWTSAYNNKIIKSVVTDSNGILQLKADESLNNYHFQDLAQSVFLSCS